MSEASPSYTIPFARPHIGKEEEEAVLRVLRSGWLTTGKEALAFEEEFAKAVGVPHACAVQSATAGLHLALEAVGVREGDLVITTPYTFTATAEVARYLGAEVLFCDIDEKTLTIDPREVERALKDPVVVRKAKVVLPVHLAGRGARMAELLEIARTVGVAVVEDAAHAFPVETPLGTLGTIGDLGVYSFYATKPITTGEGGMVVTASEVYARRVRLMRLHGIDRPVWNRYRTAGAAWYYEVVEPGFKYNMPDILAAIGRVQLRKAWKLREERKRIALRYLEAFATRDYLILPDAPEEHAWHLFILGIREDLLSITRDEYVESLTRRGIGTSVHYIPLFLMPYYRERYHLSPDDFPVSMKVYQRSFSLPLYPGLSDEEVDYVIRSVLETGDAAYRKRP
ncbi:DegT/DnrJ/EryC1/StrS family aminotransferase [Spirochaeta thermophila]|uniref:Spore coat polysaccharide biosynthesis protein C n=1 Tax=Winmispira thermophila (strain ATCC 49972 / DSM 6192 / RI 19.B1) TaxID=665571 RepID=E0RRX5_WINT6|nr:DegT/DnrJ/EryC1/StrS family aminotransferase [Spirochaeta thermophila]ADN01762.1 spore coat polysaccharide biosynthesis protein C [Spirochaeta thermophila DSM 6192]